MINPIASRSDMVLRMVAELTFNPELRESVVEPTGFPSRIWCSTNTFNRCCARSVRGSSLLIRGGKIVI